MSMFTKRGDLWCWGNTGKKDDTYEVDRVMKNPDKIFLYTHDRSYSAKYTVKDLLNVATLLSDEELALYKLKQ